MSTKFLFLFLSLAVVLIVHELGHFLAGKIFKAKIKSFNIFGSFGFHLFSTHDKWVLKLFPSLASRIEVKIGWFPLFAYVQFEDRPSEDNHDPSYLFNKPAWQRLIIFSAGVFMNFCLAIGLDAALLHKMYPQAGYIDVTKRSTEYVSKKTGNAFINYVGGMVSYVDWQISKLTSSDQPEITKQVRPTVQHSSKGTYYRMASGFPKKFHWPPIAFQLIQLNILFVFFNLLPVPPLDGGHILFSAYETIVRRPVNFKFRVWVTFFGIIFLVLATTGVIVDEVIRDF